MAFKQKRKIVKYGNASEGIVLPKEWLDYYDIRKGDEIILLGNSMLILTPKHLEGRARKLIEQSEGEKGKK
jgi:antitoxin component of MazEF toxin-antitoxin module